MFTKIKGKTFLYFIFLLALFFTSCVNENIEEPFDIEDSNEGMFELPLEIRLPYQDSVKTKSAATATELTIKDAYVLFFNSSNKYVTGMALTVSSHITSNGTTTPKIKFPFKGSLSGVTKAVVLFNTGYTSATIPLTTSNNINEICTKFPSTNWGINTTTKGLPMSGTATVSNGVAGTCTVTRVVSKVSVSTATLGVGSIGNAPISITFNSFTWKLYNYTERGRIYEDGSTVTYAFTNSGYLAVNTATRYLAPYTNSTKAGGSITVGNTVFNKNRTCVILKANVTENGTTKDCYYRLDFFSAGKYIDITKNVNYTFDINNIKSRGYSSEAEALANPGGNVDYTLAEGSGSQSVHFSNGQYLVLADKHIVYVDDSYNGTAKNLMSVAFLSRNNSNPNFHKNISTRTVEIVGSDKKTRVSTSIIQLYNSAGTAATGNILTLGENDGVNGVSAAYMLKVKTNQTALSNINNGTIYYIKISYGNIVGYIPIGVVFFDVKINSIDYLPSSGGSRTITITSRRFCPASIYEAVNIAEPWTLTNSNPYVAGKINLYTSKILTGVVTSGTGNRTFNVTLPENKYSPYRRTVVTPSAGTTQLKNTGSIGEGDLSYMNANEVAPHNVNITAGSRYSANCYVVNAPGRYAFPTAYGNAIKKGASNGISWKRSSGNFILPTMVNYKGEAISGPWITGASRAELLWTDWPNLIKDVRIENRNGFDHVCFTVPKEEICEGNAVICIKDANGVIMWSWHIWVTPYKLGSGVSMVRGYHGYTHYIMPYELGFVDKTVYTEGEIHRGTSLTFKQTSTSAQKSVYVIQYYSTITRDRYAPMYAWGRKDPICWGDDLVSNRLSYPTSVQSIPACIKNPLMCTDYITSSTVWHSGKYKNLWDNGADKHWHFYPPAQGGIATPEMVPYSSVIKTVYDPSPVGFTVANRYAFSGLVTKAKFSKKQDYSKSNQNQRSGCAWGTSYNVTSKSDAVSRGINVVTDFTNANFRDIKDFVMKDYSYGNQITFHKDLRYYYIIWTAGFADGYVESAHTFEASKYDDAQGVYITPSGVGYLGRDFGRGKDGCYLTQYSFLVRPGLELN